MNVQINLLASEFKNPDFKSPTNCPFAIKAKQVLGVPHLREGIEFFLINGKRYLHSYFGHEQWKECVDKAKELKYNEDIIHTVTVYDYE